MKRSLKKIMALAVAATMVMSMGMSVAVFAAAEPTPAASIVPTLDTSISVSGLDTGDKVNFYQVLKYDQSATTTGGWVKGTGFDLSDDEIQKILGLGEYATGKSKADQAGIDATLAAKIADMAENASAKYADIEASDGTASQSDPAPEAGLYVALVTPGTTNTIYNPVFVGADYNADNGTNEFTVVKLTDSYVPASVAKKADVTVEKTAETTEENYEDKNSNTVAVGDTVKFIINTTIPEFADNYTNPVFKVSDELSAGLKLNTASIKVYEGKYTKIADLDESKLLTGNTETGSYYDNNPAATDSAFTVKFTSKYLKDLSAAQDITIVYEAVVQDIADASVNKEDNTVTVNFSNSPTDEVGKGVLKDKTNHYTFDIDADLLGNTSYHATEVVKIGVDANGNEITQKRELSNGNSVGALAGAEFKLYTAITCAEGEEYTDNTLYTADTVIVSDADGRLTIKDAAKPGIRGLDAGTYYLKETKAPAGYIADPDPVKIEITATYKEVTYEDTVEGKTVTYKANELDTYSVKINDVETAKYTMQNDGKPDEGDKVGETNVGDDAVSGKIKNTQGSTLPSTGGAGTALFTFIGVLFLAISASLYVMKRRKMRA